MADYTELAGFVKDWSNRDVGVLSYDTIRQCIRYAHDETYRTLRIAPLEITRSGTVTSAQVNQGYLTIEDDLVEFIQLRKLADEGPRSYSSFDKPYIVAEAHSDARSFNGDTVTLYSDYSFYREGTQIHIFPLIQEGEVWELFYYRRLPEVNERFDIDELLNDSNLDNSNIGLNAIAQGLSTTFEFTTSEVARNRFTVGNIMTMSRIEVDEYNIEYEITGITEAQDGSTSITTNIDSSSFPAVTNMDVMDAEASWRSSILLSEFDKYFEKVTTGEHEDIKEIDSTILDAATLTQLGLQIKDADGEPSDEYAATDTFIGVLKEQWLRDVNEKVLLFGALHQAFDYLDEADQSGKYKAKFEQEIQKLNKEEMDRMNSGGNINVNFYNRLI